MLPGPGVRKHRRVPCHICRSALAGSRGIGQCVGVRALLSTGVFVAVAALLGACQGEHSATKQNSTKTSRSSLPISTPDVAALGERTFVVHQSRVEPGTWLTVGLHPSPSPVRIRVTGSEQRMEVCPATLDGDISAWATPFAFSSCTRLDASGQAQLPATDGATHVAFAVRVLDERQVRSLDVAVGYKATDSFVEVFPADAPTEDLTVTFTPRSLSVGAHAYVLPGYLSAAGDVIRLSQEGRSVRAPTRCDFGSEIDCVGKVTPNQSVTATLIGRRPKTGRLAVFLAWLPR